MKTDKAEILFLPYKNPWLYVFYVPLICLLKNMKINLGHATENLLPVLQDLVYFYTLYLLNRAC